MTIVTNTFLEPSWPRARHRGLRGLATILAGLVTVMAFGAEAARAAPLHDPNAPPTRRVSFADLNLRAPEGRATLISRVRVAARQVCRPEWGPPYVSPWATSACIRQSMADAMVQVDRAIVVALLDR